MSVELFGNDTEGMTDAEVAHVLADAAYQRVKGEYDLKLAQLNEVEQRLAEAEDDLLLEARGREQKLAENLDKVADANLAETLGFEPAAEAPHFSEHASAMAIDIGPAEDSNPFIWRESQIPQPNELTTLCLLDVDGEESTYFLLRRYGGDRDFFIEGEMSAGAIDALREEGRL